MILGIVGHVGENDVAFVGLWGGRFGSGLVVAFGLKVFEVLGSEYVDVTGDIFLFEGLDEDIDELFEEEFMASLESDFLDVFEIELGLPEGETVLFFEMNFEGIPDFKKDSVVVFDGGMSEPFLNIHIDS